MRRGDHAELGNEAIAPRREGGLDESFAIASQYTTPTYSSTTMKAFLAIVLQTMRSAIRAKVFHILFRTRFISVRLWMNSALLI